MDAALGAKLMGWLGSVVLNVIGNRLDATIVTAWKTTVGRLKKSGDASNKLMIALRKALWKAELALCRDCMRSEIFRELSFSDREWLSSHIAILESDLKTVDRSNYVFPLTESFDELSLLVRPGGAAGEHSMERLRERVLSTVQDDENTPAVFREAAKNALLPLMSEYFAAEIKESQQVRSIFETYVLAGVGVTVAEIVTSLQTSADILPRLEYKLDKIISDLAEFRRLRQAQPPRPITQLRKISLRYNPRFSGRQKELTRIRTVFESGQDTLVILSGLGGVGKSQLAREFLHRYDADYDSIIWVRATDHASITFDLLGVVQMLGLSLPEGEPNLVAQAVRAWLDSHSKWLLVFDSADSPQDIEPYLPTSGRGHIIVTTVNPNWAGLGTLVPINVWDPGESLTFLRGRLNRDDVHSSELAVTLGHLPLALEQAAAYIEQTGITVTDYLDRFNRDHKRVWEKGKPASGYPHTVATTWQMSFSAVRETSTDAAKFLEIAAFSAPEIIPYWALRRAPGFLGDEQSDFRVDELIAALRRYSLVQSHDDGLAVHRLIQLVMRDQLSTDETRQTIISAVTWLASVFPRYSPDKPETLHRELLPHVLCVADHAYRLSMSVPDLRRLVADAGLFLADYGQFGEAVRVMRMVVRQAETEYGADSHEITVALSGLGAALRGAGEVREAMMVQERALDILRRSSILDISDLVGALVNLGMVQKAAGNLDLAEKYYVEALKLCETPPTKSNPIYASTLNNLAALLEVKGNLKGARDYFQKALSIATEAYGADHPFVARIAASLSSVETDLGRREEGIRLATFAHQILVRAYGHKHHLVAGTANNLGAALAKTGRYFEAEKWIREALDIYEALYGPKHRVVAGIAVNLAFIMAQLGKREASRALLQRGLAISMEVNGPTHPVTVTYERLLRSGLDIGPKKKGGSGPSTGKRSRKPK